MLNSTRWIPAGMLAAGCLVNGTVAARRAGPIALRQPLSVVATSLRGLPAIDDSVPADQQRVAGMSSYIMRLYGPRESPLFTVYVGYYDEQHQGKSIHSPKNCLPGDGWDPVEKSVVTLPVAAGAVTVDRYRVVNQGHSALVYYWYQGRGRVASNEFRVKYDLLRDAALHGRTEEALVRVVVPIAENNIMAADSIARDVVAPLVTQMNQVLPKL